jgi:V8-like Glu-specific endopeptidase
MPLASRSNIASLETPSRAPLDVGDAATRGFAGTYEPANRLGMDRILGGIRRSVAVLASVIGDRDERRAELRVQLQPWRRICSLEIEAANGTFRGTGWLAGPSLVVTAGHCIYRRREFEGWAQSITVSPGRTWREQPFGRYQSRTFSCAESWVTEERIEADIGAIHLSDRVGDALGWFAYTSVDETGLQDAEVMVSGYPEKAASYDNLWTASGRVRGLRPSRLFYEADTSDGQSGSPVWIATDDAIAPSVVAIHAYEKDFTPAELPESNSATLITSDVADLITRWQHAHQP